MTDQLMNQYLAVPESGKGAGVLVLHAWWGLNSFFRNFCDRLAQEGFVALAPDLYHGKIARTIAEAEQLSSEMKQQQVIEDILSAVTTLGRISAVSGNRLGTIGFSLGAYWAMWLAWKKPEEIRAVTIFYGTGEGDFTQSKAAFQGHFAETDPYESASYINQLEKSLQSAKRPVSFFTYKRTGHWFFEEDRPDAYNAQAAQLAWERTMTFLHSTLDGAPGG